MAHVTIYLPYDFDTGSGTIRDCCLFSLGMQFLVVAVVVVDTTRPAADGLGFWLDETKKTQLLKFDLPLERFKCNVQNK